MSESLYYKIRKTGTDLYYSTARYSTGFASKGTLYTDILKASQVVNAINNPIDPYYQDLYKDLRVELVAYRLVEL